jgi:hypothetical protein
MTTVEMVVIVAIVVTANEPDRSWYGWRSSRNHCTVSNKQSELSCASGGTNNEDTAAYTTTVTQQKISNRPCIVYGHYFILNSTIVIYSVYNTNKCTELLINTHLKINVSFFYVLTSSADVLFFLYCVRNTERRVFEQFA